MPLKSIISFLKIYFYCHIPWSALLCAHNVNEILHNDHIIKPFPTWDKGCLQGRNQFLQGRSKSLNYDFCHDLVNSVTKADWSE